MDIGRQNELAAEIDRLRAINAELLAALQAITNADTSYQHAAYLRQDIGMEVSYCKRRDAIEAARAAIAKAAP